MEVDVTSPSPVALVSFGISSDVTTGGDHVTVLVDEDIDVDVELVVAIKIKMNPMKMGEEK